MPNLLNTEALELPPTMADGLFKNTEEGSSIALLSGAKPMKFGDTEFMDFQVGEAEFVDEGAAKSNTGVKKRVKRAKPHKAQITVRFNEEVQWADEDTQLGVLQSVSDQMSPKLARALDFGVMHALNPATGDKVASMDEYIGQTTRSISANTGNAMGWIDAMTQMLLAEDLGADPQKLAVTPNGLALDPSIAGAFRQRYVDGNSNMVPAMIFPDFAPRIGLSSVDGIATTVNNTVGARGITRGATTDPSGPATHTGIVGLMGDWSSVYWGVQRRIGLERILYGDPDGQGDLKRRNQIAIRMEVVFGWVIRDVNDFVKLTK